MSNTESPHPKTQSRSNLRALLALVIFMGILIVAGLVVVGVTIAVRLSNLGEGEKPAASAGGFGEATVPIPAGCAIVDSRAEGNRLIVRLGSGGRCDQLLVIDLRSGAVTGRLNFVPGP
ncbi:MAG: hypothetical protein ACKVOI_18115 [Dongiaceae bacterium]